MLSVLKHTKTPVKFWFLKNYLSPTFKVCMATEKLITTSFMENTRLYQHQNIAFYTILYMP